MEEKIKELENRIEKLESAVSGYGDRSGLVAPGVLSAPVKQSSEDPIVVAAMAFAREYLRTHRDTQNMLNDICREFPALGVNRARWVIFDVSAEHVQK
jgi:hypothetical protein